MNTKIAIRIQDTSDGEEVRHMSDHYLINCQCTNCGYKGQAYIPFGERIDLTGCPICHCVALKRLDILF